MAKLVSLHERNGWLYARIPRPPGSGRALLKPLRTKSREEALDIIRSSNLEQIALASRADALTRDVWTRLLAGRKVSCLEARNAYRERRLLLGAPEDSLDRQLGVIDQLLALTLLGNATIATLETRHISQFVNGPGAQMLSTRTYWLGTLSSWLGYCVEQRWILTNPCAEVVIRLAGLSQEQLISRPHAPFTEDEVQTLLAKVPRSDFWHGAILFGYHFGLRISNVATIEEGNIVMNRLRIFASKGRKVVDEPLPDDIIAWLAEWKTHRPASDTFYLFPFQAAVITAGESLLSSQFKRLLTKLGIEGKVFHGLRKTATNNRWSAELECLGDKDRRALMSLVAKNGFRAVQKMLSHADGSTVTENHYLARS